MGVGGEPDRRGDAPLLLQKRAGHAEWEWER